MTYRLKPVDCFGRERPLRLKSSNFSDEFEFAKSTIPLKQYRAYKWRSQTTFAKHWELSLQTIGAFSFVDNPLCSLLPSFYILLEDMIRTGINVGINLLKTIPPKGEGLYPALWKSKKKKVTSYP